MIPDCLPVWMQVEIAHFALDRAPSSPNNTNLTPPEVEGVWSQEKQLYDAMGPSTESYQPLPKAHVLGRLRWSSLGFQYDWTNRRYPQAAPLHRASSSPNAHIGEGKSSTGGDSEPETCSRITSQAPEFPPRLASIIKDIVDAVPSSVPITIEPEASIVNYFPAGTTMGGHVDDAELTYDHPVVSLSLGKSCVFLIGGLTKESEAPLGMVLRSGYVLMMHGKSRLRMHGVAKVFACPCGDPRKMKKVAGAAKKPKWSKDCTSCDDMCSSFDQELQPPFFGKTQLPEVDANSLLCHEDLGGVKCNNHAHSMKQNVCDTSNPSTCPSVCTECSQPILSTLELQRVLKYMKSSRVNINVRQVYPTGTRPSFV